MTGARMPETGQMVLLDTHSRRDTSSVIGSVRDLRVDKDRMVGRAHFTTLEEGENPWTKVREGHLTDFSVGYRVHEIVRVGENEKAVVGGRTFEGPVNVVTDWTPMELSCCPIGVDSDAKARGQQDEPPTDPKEDAMDKKLRKFLESRGLDHKASDEDAWNFLETMDVREAELATPRRRQTDQHRRTHQRDPRCAAHRGRIGPGRAGPHYGDPGHGRQVQHQ